MSFASLFSLSARPASAVPDDPFAGSGQGAAGIGAPAGPPPPDIVPPPRGRRIRWGRWILRGIGVAIVLLVVAIAWLAVTAPLSKSLKPPTPPSITLLAADGKTPIARRGAIIGAPVDVTKLPKHIPQAFMAIEDRRFYSHWGVSPRGIARAMWNNARAGGMREGGSTITQQLAKNAFLSSDRTFGRKARELMIAFWLEAWLSKDEILSRYLSNVYFGDNVYGLSAAAQHYFSRRPEQLSVAQAAMLAGLVKAPSRLAPTLNLAGARARQKLVVGAMVETGYLTQAEAADVGPARLSVERVKDLPNGTYFADWVLPAARDRSGEIANEITVTTTLDTRIQRAAERAVRRAGLRQAQVALVAMRPDGTVVAMVGGKDYRASPFNRAVQAQRQPGSTFKLFVYLTALKQGLTPDSTVLDEPVTIGDWSPKNYGGSYAGEISLARAFAKSSNVAAARLIKQVGVANVIRTARDLGVTSPLADEASIALGTSTMSLLELTSAYAAVAAGSYPVRPRGLSEQDEASWLERLRGRQTVMGEAERDGMRALLARSIESGTGRTAALSVPAYGKTGTTQDNRDALFVGYAQGLVAGVWVGNDDNSPNPGLSGGGIPARIWRDFMIDALGVAPPPAPEVEDPIGNVIEGLGNGTGLDGVLPEGIEGEIEGLGVNVRLGRDGSIAVNPADRPRDAPPPTPREDRRPPPDDEDEAPRSRRRSVDLARDDRIGSQTSPLKIPLVPSPVERTDRRPPPPPARPERSRRIGRRPPPDPLVLSAVEGRATAAAGPDPLVPSPTEGRPRPPLRNRSCRHPGEGRGPVGGRARQGVAPDHRRTAPALRPSPEWRRAHRTRAMLTACLPITTALPMRFFSDNAAPVAPAVIDAIAAANTLDTAYDGDRWSRSLDARFSDLFETDVRALWVPTGTAANCLALTTLCPPGGGIVCHRDAHINVDEGGAPEFYTHGAKLLLADGDGAKLTAGAVETLAAAIRDDVHQVQPHAISITNATEYGRVYTPAEVAAIADVAKARRLGLHMDGARFANAVARLGCAPADVTWRAGVDALSFGFVKNGGMNAEALIFFRRDLADLALRRRKRAGLLHSKGRYLAAQLLAMLDDELWLANARAANAGAALLATAAGARLVHPVEANEVFLRVTPDEAAALRALGFDFYDWAAGEARLVVSWNQTAAEIAPLAEAIAAL